MNENIYVIGDVHGCYLTLIKLIDKIGKNNIIYSVGDLVDKGPDTCKVLDFVQTLPNFKMVLGNHEDKFVEHMEMYLNDIDITSSDWFNRWGGKESLDSYNHILNIDERKNKIKSHIEFLNKQKYYFYLKEEKIFITHGFSLPYFHKRFQISNKMVQKEFTCNRLNGLYFDLYNQDNIDFLESLKITNIFGHDAHKNIKFKNYYICLDTGCVYGNKLSAYNITTQEIVMIDNIDKIKFKENMRLH